MNASGLDRSGRDYCCFDIIAVARIATAHKCLLLSLSNSQAHAVARLESGRNNMGADEACRSGNEHKRFGHSERAMAFYDQNSLFIEFPSLETGDSDFLYVLQDMKV